MAQSEIPLTPAPLPRREEAKEAAVGIDLGSRMTKIVRLRRVAQPPSAGLIPEAFHARGRACHSLETSSTDVRIFDTGHNPIERMREALGGIIRPGDAVVATGYGRNLARGELACRTVTEIRACARAAAWLDGGCRSAIDIGGQDTKAIELVGGGSFGRFEMNDRCAAGTGRFLEVMAAALGYSVEEFGPAALEADRPVHLASTCTVFAESEVVSLVARGEDRRRIALGLHVATARRVAALASRIRPGGRILLVGGVARNPCMVKVLAEELGAAAGGYACGVPETLADKPPVAPGAAAGRYAGGEPETLADKPPVAPGGRPETLADKPPVAPGDGTEAPAVQLIVPERPELAVAIGAALIGLDGPS